MFAARHWHLSADLAKMKLQGLKVGMQGDEV